MKSQVRVILCLSSFAIIVIRLISNVHCLEVNLERCKVTYVNPKYMKDVYATVRRYSRRSPYVYNVGGYKYHTWNNNVTFQFDFYEFLHNEYKRSFIQMKYKLCDLIKNDLIGPMIRKCNVSCPAPPGWYHLNNMSISSIPAVDNLPYKWPFEKGKIVILVYTTEGKEKMGEGDLIATFKQTDKPKKKSLSPVSNFY